MTDSNAVTDRTERKGRILVVDDDRTNRMMLTYRLEMAGLETATSENGLEALQMLRESDFDVVLLDILMPGMDGYATLDLMKHDQQLSRTPVIMMSAVGELDSVIRCLEMGAEDYLPKPLDHLLLTSRVDNILLKIRLQQVEKALAELTEAVQAMAGGALPAGALDQVAGQTDSVGRLARQLQQLAAVTSER
ncbi:response regulator [Streptomyces inhibens]|uniref:Response regulator n=1 Tax=Streptomyces inhibens TaxID=2293571 RepID=A0A371Q7R8_STRIH|nr:response regulator [Streptomyces inhibens]REK90745.1 response regulator [Streptomyces inhibens]UKY55471.1 response regulator [Streptomyces inhibens]